MSTVSYDDVKMPIPVPGRSAYIPEWSPTFSREDLAREVRCEGRELGFPVSSVMPERRWAIKPETGELMDVKEFTERYQLWKSRAFVDGKFVAIGQLTKFFDHTAIAVPNIVEFVNAKLDKDGREVAIAFDENARAAAPAKGLYTHEGELASEVRKMLSPDKLRAQLELLTEQHKAGKWTSEEYAKQVAALTAVVATAEPSTPEGFDAVKEDPEPPKKMHWKTREKLERDRAAQESA